MFSTYPYPSPFTLIRTLTIHSHPHPRPRSYPQPPQDALDVDIKAVSTAATMPCSSAIQNLRGSSPRTPRQSVDMASTGVATAASFRMARHLCLQAVTNAGEGGCNLAL